MIQYINKTNIYIYKEKKKRNKYIIYILLYLL